MTLKVNPCARLKKMALTGALVLASSAVWSTGVSDNLVFDLGKLNPRTDGTAAVASDIANLARWSASDCGASAAVSKFNESRNHSEGWPATGSECTDVPTPVTVTNMTFVSPYSQFQTNSEACLYFFQPTNRAQDGSLVIFGEYVKTAPVVTGTDATIYLRFRWDGNLGLQAVQNLVHNGNNASDASKYAWQVALSSTADVSAGTAYVEIGVVKGVTLYGVTVRKGEWVDLAVSCKANGSGGTDYFVYKIGRLDSDTAPSQPMVATGTFADVISTAADVGKLTIGSRYDVPNGYYNFRWNGANAQYSFGFRGALARFRVYDRALSKDEIIALMLDAPGCEFALGSANGDGSEFAADGDAGIAATFEPRTMPVRRLRGRLSSDNPTVSLKFPIAPESSRLPRVLALRPLFETSSGRADVSVSVNGGFGWKAALADGQDNDLHLPRRLMVPDADGNVTVDVTLLPSSTTAIRFDSLRLTGGWQAGVRDNASTDWCFRSETKLYYTAMLDKHVAPYGGYLNSIYPQKLHGLSNAGLGSYYPFITVGLDVPASVANGETSTYVIGCAYADSAHTRIDVYLNGSLCRRFAPPIAAGDALAVPFPAGTLTPGFNTLCISNASSTVGSGQYNTFEFDYQRYEIKARHGNAGCAIFLK